MHYGFSEVSQILQGTKLIEEQLLFANRDCAECMQEAA